MKYIVYMHVLNMYMLCACAYCVFEYIHVYSMCQYMWMSYISMDTLTSHTALITCVNIYRLIIHSQIPGHPLSHRQGPGLHGGSEGSCGTEITLGPCCLHQLGVDHCSRQACRRSGC